MLKRQFPVGVIQICSIVPGPTISASSNVVPASIFIEGDTFQPDNDSEGFIASMDPTANIGIDQTKNAWTSYGDNGEADDTQDSQRAIAEYQKRDRRFGGLTTAKPEEEEAEVLGVPAR